MNNVPRSTADERDRAAQRIADALKNIEEQGREPDQWERACLVQAIGMLFRGGYRLAAVDADLAMTPLDQRSRTPIPPDSLLDRCDIMLLREGLHEAVVQPVIAFPAFGPLVFTGGSSP